MGIKRHKPEEIVTKLRQVEVLCGRGMPRIDAISQVQITEQHYGTMSDDRRFDVLENIGSKKTIDPSKMSEADKAKAFDAMLKAFNPSR